MKKGLPQHLVPLEMQNVQPVLAGIDLLDMIAQAEVKGQV